MQVGKSEIFVPILKIKCCKCTKLDGGTRPFANIFKTEYQMPLSFIHDLNDHYILVYYMSYDIRRNVNGIYFESDVMSIYSTVFGTNGISFWSLEHLKVVVLVLESIKLHLAI